MYKSLPDHLSYSDLELEVLKFWQDRNIFDKSLALREGAPYFCFYEGPPTVNGKPGIHHMMARTIKDTICRYKTMQGYYVRRQAGWDTHGLPVEITVEKELGLNSKEEVLAYGIGRFNQACRDFVYKNIDMAEGWRYLTDRMGYWIDLDKAYITCTTDYVESVWWALKTYFDKGLIYRGFKVVPQSPTIETPLSSHELSLGYKDVKDPNCYLKLKVESSPIKELVGKHLLVWTTTPWTLLSNVALAAGSKIDYVLVRNTRTQKDNTLVDELILAESRLNLLDGEYEVLKKFKGIEMMGSVYEQIFDYKPIDRNEYPNALTVLSGNFVSTQDGSGIVHMAPAFGEDDYEMSKIHNLPFLQYVTPNGHIIEGMGEFSGRAIKNFTYPDHVEEGADKDLVIYLKKAGKIYRSTNDYLHSYPHCWRTGNPVMYYARESWFIKSPEFKEQMIELNNTINWQPPEIGEGRFGNWLEEVKEWNLSRNRFWGSPIPIWVSEDDSDMFAIGSIDELKQGIFIDSDGKEIELINSDIEIDLHRPFVDQVIFRKGGKTYHRIPEIVDVWFDSGAMPFAQLHYPFENQDLFDKIYPGDFIAEGIDQTRGWFYTLHNIGTALFGKPAFKNIVVNELILDKHGHKMSKSKGNTVDPFEIMNKYGADAVRWYLFVNNPPWKPTSFDEKALEKTVLSDFFRSLTNTYAFFALYANIDEFTGLEEVIPVSDRPVIDKWIVSRVNTLLGEYSQLMDDYELTKSHRAIQSFVIDELSNWYIRRNRRRFWKGEKDMDKIAAYQTLREVLIAVISMMSPAAPFLSDALYMRLRNENESESIHLIDLPKKSIELIDPDLERKMELAQRIVSLARSLREKSSIRTRQPLRRILVPVQSIEQRRDIQYFELIIKEELNIKSIDFVSGDTDIVKRSAKPNFKLIGKKFGKNTQKVAELIRKLKNQDLKTLETGKSKDVELDGEIFNLSLEDIEIVSEDIEGWLVAIDGNITVALDTQLDDKLLQEGLAREFVNRIQNIRKESGFEVTDRIRITHSADGICRDAFEAMEEYIRSETLCESILLQNLIEGDIIEIDESKFLAKIEKLS